MLRHRKDEEGRTCPRARSLNGIEVMPRLELQELRDAMLDRRSFVKCYQPEHAMSK